MANDKPKRCIYRMEQKTGLEFLGLLDTTIRCEEEATHGNYCEEHEWEEKLGERKEDKKK